MRYRFLIPGVTALIVALVPVLPAHADRHCSFARESAFYARALSAEALKAPAEECATKMSEAMERLRNAMIELEICSCAPAEAPLRRWFDGRPADGIDKTASCHANAAAINEAATTTLGEVEKCF